MKNFKTFMEDITLKDIAKKEKESMYNTGAEASKTVRIMQKQIKREKSDDVIIVKLSDDKVFTGRVSDSVMRVGKDELKKYLKKGYEKLK
jgi:ribosomal protein S4E